MPLLFFTQAAAPPESVLLELSHGLELMLLPISDEVPLLLQRLSHPETPELRQLGIGEHVGHDQEQRATPWTTPLFSAAEVPLTVWRARSKRCEPWLRKSARTPCGTSHWSPHECEEASPRLWVRWMYGSGRVSGKFQFGEEVGQNHVAKCKQSHSDRVPWPSA